MILRYLVDLLLASSLAALLFDAAIQSTLGTALQSTSLIEFWHWLQSLASSDTIKKSGQLPGPQGLAQLPLWLVLGVFGISLNFLDRRARMRNDSAAMGYLRTRSFLGLIIVGGATFAIAGEVSSSVLDGSEPSFLTTGRLWEMLHAESSMVVQQSLPSSFWMHPLLVSLRIPVWVVVGLLGFLLYRLGIRSNASNLRANREGSGEVVAGPSTAGQTKKNRSDLQNALATCRGALIGVGVFSGLCNILMLAGAFYMLQVYDRVLTSRSIATLLALSILVAGLFLAHAFLDTVRRRILMRVGVALDDAIANRIYQSIVRLPQLNANQGDGLRPMRDMDAIRTFLAGQGPTALFDLPWMPVYLAIIFYMHTWLGTAALAGAIFLVALTLTTELLTRRPTQDVAAFAMSRNGLAEASRRNSEAIIAMGMTEKIGSRWTTEHLNYVAGNQKSGDIANDLGSLSRSLRLMLQSGVLGLGAYLVINGQATAGIIIAGAILVSRALAPIDLAIANWKGFVAARQSWQRLDQLLKKLPEEQQPMLLPSPHETLSVEQVSAAPPGSQTLVVQDVNFTLKSRNGLGVIGPSGSGKSSLARMLVGVWSPVRGQVRLDKATLMQWSSKELGSHVGYLPQDVELFSGSIAENIARFETNADPELIIAAAQAAGVHNLIVSFPDGYETELGDQGKALSAGQRQRLALARALYRDPFLVVLDEPNSNLDREGEIALTNAILGVRSRGGIVIVVAHRQSALAGVDMVLALDHGKQVAFGPKDEVLAKVLQPQAVRRPPGLAIMPEGGNDLR